MSIMNEQEKKNREELFELMQEYQGLPIVPMVDSEVVADNCYMWWLAHWGNARIDAYLIVDERVYIKSLDDEYDVLAAVHGWEKYEKMTDEEAYRACKELPWIEAIIVHITM